MEKNKKNFYVLYTVVFAFLSLFIFSYFTLNGKSLVWSHDGVPQHVNSLAYYGRYLREILKTVFVDHSFQLPMWDLHIGYGSDILTTLHYYVIGDPLTLLSVFVPESHTEILYEALIFLRIYLAGISFSLYCFYHKNPKQAVFFGTLIYIFAGWTIYAAMKHPYFSNPMIYLPLILMGIDKIYKKEKPHLFIWMVTVAAMSNFYFFYMIGIFMFLYAAFRYFQEFSERSVKDVFQWFFKFLGYFIIAMFLAAIIFLPVVMTLFGTDRFQAENYVPLLYDKIYYGKFLGCLIGENMIQWGVAGYSAISMAGVFVLFAKKRKYFHLKAGFILLNLFLLIPFAGHVLNGFSYVSNRWIWAYGMMIAYIFVKAYPELFTLTKQEKQKVFCMFFLFCGLALWSGAARTERNMAAIMLLSMTVMVILCFGTILLEGKYLCGLLAGLLTISIMANVSYQYSYEKDYLSEFSEEGEALKKLQSGADMAVLSTGDDSLYRYDQLGSLPYDNTSMQMGTNSTAYYFSVANGNISRFFDEMYLNTPWEQHYENLDGRTILDHLAAVKYFVIQGDDYSSLPYGYMTEKGYVKKGKKEYRAYGCKEPLPIGYTYDSFLSREEYEKLSVTEKQQALLQGIVLEDSSLPKTIPAFDDESVSYKFAPEEGCEISDGEIRVTKPGASLKLVFQGLPESETYLVVKGLDYDSLSPRELISKKEWKKMTEYEKNSVRYEESQWRYWKETKEASIGVSTIQTNKKLKIFTNKYNAYSGKHDFLCNTGYQNEQCHAITLTFDNTGVYSYDELEVVCQPVKNLSSQIRALGEETLTDLKPGINSLSGKISLSKPKALLLALPYSKGFRAYVDGKEQEILEANTMYMALELEKGNHEIYLTYRTPYLRTGALLSLLGIIAYIILCIREKSHKMPKKERQGKI